MEIQIEEKKREIVTEPPPTNRGTITLTRVEYEELWNAFCKGKGWSGDYPHTINLHRIVLRGNYKWHPLTDVELDIEIEGPKKDLRTERSNNDPKNYIEKENFKA